MDHEQDGRSSSQEKAEQDYNLKVRIIDSVEDAIGGEHWTRDEQKNVALGQNILREEIGFFGPCEGASYSFDERTRDRLLAHTRQDVAAAFAMARSAFRHAHAARKMLRRVIFFQLGLLALNAAILAAVLTS